MPILNSKSNKKKQAIKRSSPDSRMPTSILSYLASIATLGTWNNASKSWEIVRRELNVSSKYDPTNRPNVHYEAQYLEINTFLIFEEYPI